MNENNEIVDLLDRQGQANALINFFKSFAETENKIHPELKKGYIMAITASWGNGKTTFVKMLQKLCEKEKIANMYFSVWESDFLQNPIAYIVHEFFEEIKLIKKEKMISAFEKRKLFEAVSFLTEASEESNFPVVKTLGKVTQKIVTQKNAITDYYVKVNKAKNRIKENLKKIANELRINMKMKKEEEEGTENIEYTPLVIFIDEIDRCRPNYVVDFLEAIKHIFNIPNVIFVLSLDKEQLEKSIKHMYGSDTDTKEYLHRFFEFEYVLNPENKHFDYHFKEITSKLPFFLHGNYNFPTAFILKKLFEYFEVSCRGLNSFIKTVLTIDKMVNDYNKISGTDHFIYILLFFYIFNRNYFHYLFGENHNETSEILAIKKFIEKISYNDFCYELSNYDDYEYYFSEVITKLKDKEILKSSFDLKRTLQLFSIKA